MLSAIAVSGYTLPLPTLPGGAYGQSERPRTDVLAKLAKLSEAQAKARTELKEQRDRFKALFERARELATNPGELQQLAEAVHSRELEAAAVLAPQIEKLRENLSHPKGNANTPLIQSWRRLAEESLEIGITWLELYQNLQIQLFKLASDLRSVGEPGSETFLTAEEVDKYLRRLMAE